ncbi:AAA ATPase [Histomonas meleagridis]|uniref:AAA ATPase n=1 Tax=Histomonas meleagridis TaxID=135588 RepID=UPI00355AAB4B|nr:AAA ATPase [Histomonas meleagridis]KAH0804915.1 AAA ATPase [Histomonas meleagridis]
MSYSDEYDEYEESEYEEISGDFDYIANSVLVPINFAILMNPNEIRAKHFAETFVIIRSRKQEAMVKVFPSQSCQPGYVEIPKLLMQSLKLSEGQGVSIEASEIRIKADAIQIAPLFDPGMTDYQQDLSNYFRSDFHGVSSGIGFSIYVRGSILNFVVLKTLPNTFCYTNSSTRIVFNNQRINFASIPSLLSDLVFKPEVEEQIKKLILLPITHTNIFASTCLRFSNGILITGTRSTGKTAILTAISKSLKHNSCILDAFEFATANLNDAFAKLQRVFAYAIECSPSVLMIDNLNTILNNKKLYMLFLSLLDRAISQSNIIVVATINDLSQVDKSIIRDGRFAFIIELSLPTKVERQVLITKKLRGIRYSDRTIEIVSDTNTEGNTCAEVIEITERAVFSMFNKKQFPSDQEIISQLNTQIDASDFPRIEPKPNDLKEANGLNDLSINDLMGMNQSKIESDANADDKSTTVFEEFFDFGLSKKDADENRNNNNNNDFADFF